MADVFISYARADRETASALAGLLTNAGLSVWWDCSLRGGSTFHDEIERELNDATRVIVIWSPRSVSSHWVRDEAGVAQEQNKLSPLTLEGQAPPLGFRSFHTVAYEEMIGDVPAFLRDLGMADQTSSSAPSTPDTGDNAECEVNLPLELAYTGGQQVVEVATRRKCEECEDEPSSANCEGCDGVGWSTQTSFLNVPFPEALLNGDRIRLDDEGNYNPVTGAYGHLNVIVNIEQGAYALNGSNLEGRLILTADEAANGRVVSLPDLKGGSIDLQIPAGIQQGQWMRFNDLGWPAARGRAAGDLLLYIDIEE